MTAIGTTRPSRLTRWLEGKRSGRIINFVVIPALVIAILLLPPISAVQRVTDLGTTQISEAGGTLTDPDGTQVIFLPGTINQRFGATLNSVPRPTFLAGSAGKELLEAAKSIPATLVAKSPFYQLKLRGEAPTQSTWIMPIPNDSEPYETLDVYTWDQTSQSWQWLPHNIIREDDQIESHSNAVPQSAMVVQTNPQPALVAADLALASALPADGQGALAQVQPTGLYLGSNGAIDGAIDATFDKTGGAYDVVPVIRNYEGPIVRTDLLSNMLVDNAQRDAHIDNLVNLAVGNLYKGIDIDYRGLDQNLRGEFNQFIKELADKLHAQGKELSVRVDLPSQVSEDRWETGPYDWQTIGLLADTVKVPAPEDPRAYVPDGQLDALLRYAVGQINRSKLQLILTGQSVEQAGNYLLLKRYEDALQPLLGRVASDQSVVEPGQPLNLALVSSRPTSGLVYDPNIGTYVYRYQDDQGNARTVWLENAASLGHKLDILKKYNLQGFTLQNLPADGLDPDLWSLMKNYQQGRVQPIENNFVVEWTVKGSDGTAVSQVRPLTDPNVAFAAPNEGGSLQVEAVIKDRGQVIARQSGDTIAVATFTPSPTPTPEFTPTPAATPTPEFAEVTATTNANVRSGPGTAYSKVGTLSNGATYRVTGQSADGSWWQISYDGQQGWVSGDVVNVGGNAQAVAVVEVAPPPTAAPVAAKPAAAASSGQRYPSAPGTFGYGMQIPNYNVSGFSSQIKGAGFNWVKFQIPWKDVEGSPGGADWGGTDGTVNAANAAGLNVLLSVPKAPAWARPSNSDMSVEGPPADPNTYAAFVGQMAGRYCGKVNAIEVWNEQNLWYEWGHQALSAADYVRLLGAAYRAIKSACPQISVISGALTPTGVNDGAIAIDDMAYLEQMYQAGLKSVSDGIGAHPSGFNVSPDVGGGQAACDFIRSQGSQFVGPCNSLHHSWSFRATMEGYRAIMAKYGDSGKRIWPTEFGWASGWMGKSGYEYANDNTAQEEADWTVRAYQMMKGWGWVGPAFLWNLGYTDPDGGQWNIDGRPAYSALRDMPK